MKSISLTVMFAVTALLFVACSGKEPPASPSGTALPGLPAEQASLEAVVVQEGGEVGKKIYGTTCAMCHASGLAGAPKPGDKEAWGVRSAQGRDALYQHAIEGFTGESGFMPAKGGNASIGDDDVKAAVDYMLGQS